MPLKFINHELPPQLEEEFRNLYRQIDRLTAGTGTAIITPGVDDGEVTDLSGTVHRWAVLTALGGSYWPDDGEIVGAWEVASIEGSYTHLEVDVAVMGAAGGDITLDWIIRGNDTYWIFNPPGGLWLHVSENPIIYTVDALPYVSGGRYRLEPQHVIPPQDGDLAYTPITPDDVYGQEKDKIMLIATARRTIGGDPGGTWCYTAWWVGRYVSSPNGDGLPNPYPCPPL